jgi:chromosomal replication initiator protein
MRRPLDRGDPEAARAALHAALAARLPTHLVEVLAPAIRVVRTADGLRLAPRSAAWAEVIERHAAGVVAGLDHPLGLDPGTDRPVAAAQPTTTFATTLADPGNRMALAACRRAVEAPGLEHNPLYLHGGPGTGKSHLLSAAAHEARRTLGDAAVLVLSAQDLVATAAQELSEGRQGPLRESLDRAMIVIIDDVDVLAGRNLAQEELFHLINRALDHGQQLILAGSQPPRRLADIEDRLTTRLAWGLVVALEPTHLETRVALVRRLAGQAGNDQGDDLTALVERIGTDLHRATALGRRLAAGEPVEPVATAVAVEAIIDLVAARLHLRPGDIAGKRRHRPVVTARQLVLWLARRHTSHGLIGLGALVGGRDHTTIMHALREAERRRTEDAVFRDLADSLDRAVTAIQRG